MYRRRFIFIWIYKKLFLRPSCYNCHFKEINRQADITLADFWGIEYFFPELDDDKGTSLVVINSSKANALVDALDSRVIKKVCEVSDVVKYNSFMVNSTAKPKEYENFWNEMYKYNFNKTIKKYCKMPLLNKIKKYIKNII